MKKERGFGLPEILISLLLASFILIALTTQYLRANAQHRHAERVMSQAFEVESAVDFMRESIRGAGFTPCLSIDHLITVDGRTNHKLLKAIEVQPDQQSIQIQRMGEYFDEVMHMNPPSEVLASDPMFKPNQTILIADCVHAEVQNVRAVYQHSDGQKIILSNPLFFNYQPPIFIGEWIQERFYVQRNGQDQLALFYRFNRADELTSYVQGMSVHLKEIGKHVLVSVVLNTRRSGDLEFETLVRS